MTNEITQSQIDAYYWYRYKERLTRFKTAEEFKIFCDSRHVYYKHGFGYTIQALITNDEEFIDFMLNCCVYKHGGGGEYYPFFINYYDHTDKNNHLYFKVDPTENSDEDLDDGEYFITENGYAGTMPSVKTVAYCADYNNFEDLPFEVIRVDNYMTYPADTFRVNPKTSKKFPAIVRLTSMDTFDRCGSVKGEDLTIISLADVSDKRIMFV